jgi:hypothetical protein
MIRLCVHGSCVTSGVASSSAVDLVELTHPTEIAAREPALTRQHARQVPGQAVNDAFPQTAASSLALM